MKDSRSNWSSLGFPTDWVWARHFLSVCSSSPESSVSQAPAQRPTPEDSWNLKNSDLGFSKSGEGPRTQCLRWILEKFKVCKRRNSSRVDPRLQSHFSLWIPRRSTVIIPMSACCFFTRSRMQSSWYCSTPTNSYTWLLGVIRSTGSVRKFTIVLHVFFFLTESPNRIHSYLDIALKYF